MPAPPFPRCLAPALVLAAWSLACGPAPPPPPAAPPPTRAAAGPTMPERLARLTAESDPEKIRYRNSARVERLRARLGAGAPRPDRLPEHAELARELLRAGRTEEALAEIERIVASGKEHRVPVSAEFVRFLQELKGVAWLRLGEQENCILSHTQDSCLLPIEGGGVHSLERGSRNAIAVYSGILERDPSDLKARWLLNLAHQTLGEHPQGVDPRWLIPAEHYRSKVEFARFRDAAPAVGLAHVALSGGAVLDDFDGDGLLDAMMSSWGFEDQLKLFRNRGDGRFEDFTEAAGLSGQTGGLNLVHADPDGDGDLDVLVLRGAWLGAEGAWPNSFLRNRGDGTFEDATEEAGLLSFHPTQTAAWADFDGDGFLDLFIGNESGSVVHPPELYRNLGDGTFREIAAEVGLAEPGFVKAVAWGDVDGDGDPDLFQSRMHQPNRLFRNDGPAEPHAPGAFSWRFTDVSAEAGIEAPTKSFPAWFFDQDEDGDLDLFVASFGDFTGDALAGIVAARLGLPSAVERCRLYRNRGDGTFEDASVEAGADLALLAMGANFGDLDEDGRLDMYLGTGEPNLGTLVPNVALRNTASGRFEDVTEAGGFGNLQKGHGIAFGDVDGDGDQDVLAVMGGAYEGDVYQNLLLENPGHGRRWVTLRLRGPGANRFGHGAWVRLRLERPDGTTRSLLRVVGTGGSFGSSSLQLEVGLDDAVALPLVEVRWPGSTEWQAFEDLPLDSVLELEQGSGEARVVEVPSFALAAEPMHGAHAH